MLTEERRELDGWQHWPQSYPQTAATTATTTHPVTQRQNQPARSYGGAAGWAGLWTEDMRRSPTGRSPTKGAVVQTRRLRLHPPECQPEWQAFPALDGVVVEVGDGAEAQSEAEVEPEPEAEPEAKAEGSFSIVNAKRAR